MTRDEELWGVALWVERTHGAEGEAHIAAQMTRLATDGDEAGIVMWRLVSERFDRLRESSSLQ